MQVVSFVCSEDDAMTSFSIDATTACVQVTVARKHDGHRVLASVQEGAYDHHFAVVDRHHQPLVLERHAAAIQVAIRTARQLCEQRPALRQGVLKLASYADTLTQPEKCREPVLLASLSDVPMT